VHTVGNQRYVIRALSASLPFRVSEIALGCCLLLVPETRASQLRLKVTRGAPAHTLSLALDLLLSGTVARIRSGRIDVSR
jgi:hypothetical protein